MQIKTLMSEYNLEIDDIRWYLSSIMAEKLLSQKDNLPDLIKYIWSGSLEDELYNLEEQFLADLQDSFDRGITDESNIREHFSQADNAKGKRVY